MHYFAELAAGRYRPTEHVGGAWDLATQHVAPSLGLVVDAVERDHAARGGSLLPARLSFEILGTMTLEEMRVETTVIRPGRTIELVEARIVQQGRTAVALRAWLAQSFDTAHIAAGSFAAMTPIDQCGDWPMAGMWRGGYIASITAHRIELGRGRAQAWIGSTCALLDGRAVSPLAQVMRLVDTANGVAALADPADVHFPNIDLTAHLFRQLVGEPVGCDVTVAFGPGGLGVTHSILHDRAGPFGCMAQSLTVRPRQAG